MKMSLSHVSCDEFTRRPWWLMIFSILSAAGHVCSHNLTNVDVFKIEFLPHLTINKWCMCVLLVMVMGWQVIWGDSDSEEIFNKCAKMVQISLPNLEFHFNFHCKIRQQHKIKKIIFLKRKRKGQFLAKLHYSLHQQWL